MKSILNFRTGGECRLTKLSAAVRIGAVATAIVLAAGCTTSLKVQRVDPNDNMTMVGAPYPLMFTRYQVDVTRQVAACGPQIKIATKVEVKAEEAAPDARQLFVIDTNSLASPVKTSEVKLSYATSGAVTSLNASAEDRSAQVIANVIGAVVKTVALSAAPGASPTAAQKPQACNEAVIEVLKTVEKQEPIVKAATKLTQERTEALAQLIAKATKFGNQTDALTRKKMSEAYDALQEALADHEKQQQILDQALKSVSDVQTVYWPEHGDQAAAMLRFPQYLLRRWGRIDDNPGVLAKQALYVQIAPVDPPGRALVAGDPGTFVPDTVTLPYGVVPYRLPAAGHLRICQGAPCGGGHPADVEKTGPILQLGRVYYLPCESRPFTSIGCAFEMTDAGQLKTMGTIQKAAPAESASGALKDALTQLSTARTEAVQTKTNLVKAQNEYAAAVAASVADPEKADKDATAALNVQVELKKAKLADLEAEQALRNAQARLGQP
ncbi:MAG: hypothetical protein V4864_16990 [Pseudomonadota bacterium]